MNHAVTAYNLKKLFHNTEVFRDLSIDIEEGKITALIGPNGCGKSTLLNILAGLIKQDGGDFQINNFNHFNFSYIFQNYRESLLPWRSNLKNLALPLEIQKRPKQEIGEIIKETQNKFGFEINWRGCPYELSGGQQQILAFMRALVTKPKILFIDEPFSALDYENNLRLREYLQKYYLAFHPTIILITHNIEEAVHLADKIIILSQKPTKIIEIINNPLPYPRTLETTREEKSNQIASQVLSAFQKATNP